jgi:hypothetical protein
MGQLNPFSSRHDEAASPTQAFADRPVLAAYADHDRPPLLTACGERERYRDSLPTRKLKMSLDPSYLSECRQYEIVLGRVSGSSLPRGLGAATEPPAGDDL